MRSFSVFLSLFLWQSLFCQTNTFIPYGIEQGFNSKHIYKIAQDRGNDLVIATERGLFSFDGYEFEQIVLENENDHSFISELFIDSQGILWVGNNIGQVWRQKNSHTKSMETLSFGLDSEIIKFREDPQNKIWIGSRTGGISVFHRDRKKPFSKMVFTEEMILNSLEILDEKYALLGTNEGLDVYEFNYNEIWRSHNVDGIPHTKVTFIKKIKSHYYVGTSDEGLFVLEMDQENNAFRSIDHPISGEHDLVDLESTKNNVLWLATPSHGLIQLDQEQKEYFGNSEGIESENISCLFKDQEQNLWIGTYGKGLYRKYNSPFKPLWDTAENDIEVKDIIEFEGRSFLASREDLYVLNDLTSRINLKKIEDVANPLSLAKFEDVLFAATAFDGIKSIENREVSDRFKELKEIESINHILVSDDRLYISTSTSGLIIYDLIDKSSKHYTTQNGLTHNEVNSCFVDKSGKIWLAMSGTVLNALENGVITLYGKKEGLHQFDLSSIIEDEQGNIWVSSDGGGLYLIKNGEIVHFQKDEGLSSNYIISLVSSGKGNVWAASKNSLTLLNSDQKPVRKYDTKENIYNFSISKNGLKNWNDTLLLCTEKGLFMYDENNDISSSMSPGLRFTRVQINDSLYSLNEPIDLPYGKYSLQVHFKTKYLAHQQKIKYRFYLDGQEEGYGPVFNDPTCYYPGLLKGDQELKVICTDLNGYWMKEPIILDIRIDIPFYQKPVFVAFTSLGVLLLMSAIVYYRERTNKKINAYLSTELDHRTLEVRKQKDELVEKNQEIQDSIIYAERIQRSMLSSENCLEENTIGHFILYKPRDIVSGDFYWFAELDGHFVFAGADCTGHGVPGSMMSMICISELDKAVKVDRLIDPEKILRRVNQGLKEALRQNEDSTTNDGMDIALCVLDKKKNVLHFAGAGRPCYIIRNGELEELKGSRDHIGGNEVEQKEIRSA